MNTSVKRAVRPAGEVVVGGVRHHACGRGPGATVGSPQWGLCSYTGLINCSFRADPLHCPPQSCGVSPPGRMPHSTGKGVFPSAGPGTTGHRAVIGVRCAGQQVVAHPRSLVCAHPQAQDCVHGGQHRRPGVRTASTLPPRSTPSDSVCQAAARSVSGTSGGPETLSPVVLSS